MMAIPKPDPGDWLIANAQEIQVTDREVLRMLRDAKKRVDKILAELPQGKQDLRRAQLEQTRAKILAEQANIFERLNDIVSARRARAASRAARLSAAADNALLRLVGKGAQGQFLYESALQVSQRGIDAAMARMKLSALPLSKRIYNTSVWMQGRLGRLINETLASGLNAKEFAKRARDWFNPNTPGGVRYAAMRLARTEINNAFHSMSAQKYADTPWIDEVEWNLSKSHPKPDICNTYAKESPYDSKRVPARPHPQCMCYITSNPIDEDDFVENFLKGDYDQFLDDELAKNGWQEPEEPEPTRVADAGTHAQTPEKSFNLHNEQPLTFERKREIVNEFAFGGNGTGSLEANAALRGLIPMSAETRKLVSDMDSLFESEPPLDKQKFVYRAISNDEDLRSRLVDIAAAEGIWNDPGYQSTTTSRDIAEDFASGEAPLLIRIEVPEGTTVLDMSKYLDFDKVGIFDQKEFVLNRGTSLQLSKPRRQPDGSWVVNGKVTTAPVQSKTAGKPKVTFGNQTEINPKTSKDGYAPGHWQQQTNTDDLIAETLDNVKKLNPALGDEQALEFAKMLVAGTTDDDQIRFKNGPHEVIFAGKLSSEKQQEFLGYIDHMQSKFPANRELAIRVAPSSEFGWDVGGETTISTGHMRINERVLTQKIWPGMPISSNVPSALYVLAHEWGHAFPDKKDARNTHVHGDAVAAGGMTKYGRIGGDGKEGNAAEGYAEAFAEWSLTDGKTTNLAALEYARRFHWEERFGNHNH